MAAYEIEKVLTVHHWNESLFTFTCTRGASLRFESGHFVMVGLMVAGKPLMRAYSIASAHWEEHLEFFSIKVQDGPLTSRLQHLKVGDDVLVGRKPTGTLVLTDLLPGRNLYLFATGTGLAPFMSIIRDPDTYERFAKDRPRAWHAQGRRARLRRPDLARAAAARPPRRAGEGPARLLPDGHARAVPQPGPPAGPDRQRQALQRHRLSADRSRPPTAQ